MTNDESRRRGRSQLVANLTTEYLEAMLTNPSVEMHNEIGLRRLPGIALELARDTADLIEREHFALTGDPVTGDATKQ